MNLRGHWEETESADGQQAEKQKKKCRAALET